MDDYAIKSKSNKKKSKKHHHYYHQSANGTKEEKKTLLKPPLFDSIHPHDTHNGGKPHIIVANNNELDVIVKAKAFSFNPKTNSYILKLENVRILSIDGNNVIFEIPPDKIHKESQTQLLHEEDIDAILDEIHHTEHPNSDHPHHIQKIQIKAHHSREESKQQIPIINNHEPINTMDSLRSIPPIPSPSPSYKQNHNHNHNNHNHNNHNNNNNKYRFNNSNKKQRKHQLMSEWKQIETTHKNIECKDGESMRHCQSIERVKFMLKYYAKWVKIRTTKSSQTQNEISSHMKYYENITSLFLELGYNAVSLTNDFEHIRDFHINNNSSLLLDDENDNDMDDMLDSVSQQNGKTERRMRMRRDNDTMEFFGIVLGKCDAKNCNILLRHCRDRDKIDNKQELKRKKLFFISDDKFGGDNIEWTKKEIYLETKLDIIHCALLHQQTNVMLLNKNKFITEIIKHPAGDHHHNHANVNTNEEEHIKLNNYGNINKKKIMAFGESITYWDNKHHLYISCKYNNLRTELLNNKLYQISKTMFEQIKYFIISFLNSNKGRLLVSQREHDWMKSYKIKENIIVSINHLIAVYTYTNITAMRDIFISYGYRHYYNHNEYDISIHKEICNWSRLLLECVHSFGNSFNQYWRYYHGINCKLLFDRFNIMIDVPCSLTLDKDFAYTFSSSSCGIMIEVNHGTLSDLQSLCFNNSLLSEFPFEEERFIFHSYVSICDIVINGLHHDQWLKIFGFWYKLKEGFFFDHLIGSMGVTKNDQLCICAMIINMMLGANNSQHNKYDARIPYYMQCLFNECIQNKAFVWIIESEYIHLAPKLKSLLYYNPTNINKSSQFIKYLVTEKKCNVCKCNTFNWDISDNQFESLLTNNEWIKSVQYKIYLYFDRNYNARKCLAFHFEVQNKIKNGLFRCRIHLDDFPKEIHKINLGVGIYADKVNIDNYSYAEIQTKHKLYNSSLHSLFKTKLLRKFHSLKLKLQIQLFYLHDQSGKIIKFQPV